MENRVAVIGIIVENLNSVNALNEILHSYTNYIIGRMGIPYRSKNINVISIAVDAPEDIINAIAGKISNLEGITAKTAFSGYCNCQQ